MNDTYVEVMVKRRTSPLLGPGRMLCWALAIACLLIAMLGNFACANTDNNWVGIFGNRITGFIY